MQSYQILQETPHKLKIYSPNFDIEGTLKIFQNLNVLHLFVALLQDAHFPKGIKQKSFHCKIWAITLLLLSSDSYHEKVLLEYLTIPLTDKLTIFLDGELFGRCFMRMSQVC